MLSPLDIIAVGLRFTTLAGTKEKSHHACIVPKYLIFVTILLYFFLVYQK